MRYLVQIKNKNGWMSVGISHACLVDAVCMAKWMADQCPDAHVKIETILF